MQAQLQWWQQMGELWQHGLRRAAGEAEQPVVEPDPADRRFKDDAWSEELVFDYIKQSYLLAARWVQSTVAEVDSLDPKTKRKVGVLHPAVRRCVVADQFRAHQPDRPQAGRGNQRRKPAQADSGIS